MLKYPRFANLALSGISLHVPAQNRNTEQESLRYTLQVRKRFTTCSCIKGLYFEDLKLEKEEEHKGEER